MSINRKKSQKKKKQDPRFKHVPLMNSLHPNGDMETEEFAQRKQYVLEKMLTGDLSPKGSIDAPIRELLDCLNVHEKYVTLSSCSGRVSLFVHQGHKGGRWIYCDHEKFEPVVDHIYFPPVPIVDAWELCHLKFDPFILHVEAVDMEAARNLLKIAISAGFADSGLMVAKRTIVVIRSASRVDLPIGIIDPHDGFCHAIVSHEYLELIMNDIRMKWAQNERRWTTFWDLVKSI